MAIIAGDSQQWLLGPKLDFLLIHGACGLLFLPLVFLARSIPGTWTIAVYFYAYLLSRPHMAATWVRMGDSECRKYLPLLGWMAPLVIATSLYLLVIVWKLLAIANLFLFLASLLHQSLQNFGIMRAYVAKSKASPRPGASRFASLAVQVAPFACVFYFLSVWMPSSFFLIPLWLPPAAVVKAIALVFILVTGVVILGYAICEYRQWCANQICLGRLFSVLSSLSIYFIAYQVMAEIHWGYIIASAWHSIQYLAYNQAFRKSPPVGAQLLNLSPLKYLFLLIGFSAIIYLIQNGLIVWAALFYPLASFTVSFHHYFADALLWRRGKSKLNSLSYA